MMGLAISPSAPSPGTSGMVCLGSRPTRTGPLAFATIGIMGSTSGVMARTYVSDRRGRTHDGSWLAPDPLRSERALDGMRGVWKARLGRIPEGSGEGHG